MGLWNWIETKLTGVDLNAEQARSNAADAATSAMNQQLLDQGTWTQDQANAANMNIAAGDAETGAGSDVWGAVEAEAEVGLKEGLNNVLTAPGKVVGAVGSGAGTLLWGIIKAIPWWAWLGGAAALFVWMGGLSLLRGRLARQ